MVFVSDYSLPDREILNQTLNQVLIWIPDRTYVVLGASNEASDALIAENIAEDRIPVLKRKSGGQTVVLSPENIIVSALITDERIAKPLDVFLKFNELMIMAIERGGVSGLSTRGVSDIAFGDKKISGSSIYRKKDKLFYHAVINYGESPNTFERYLKHPLKEPDYRMGRGHANFVTSLREIGYSLTIGELKKTLSEVMPLVNE